MAGEAVSLSCLISSHTFSIRWCMDSLCMSCQCVACCEVSIMKVSLFACIDPVDVSLHDALVVEACRLHFRFYWISGQVFQQFCSLLKTLATFNEFKFNPSIVNNKIENWEQFVIKNNKYSEKQASLKLHRALTMPTALVRTCIYTDMCHISYHSFLAFWTQLTLENMWILNQEINPEKNIEIAQQAFQQ
jgi:hypothetical protein